MSTIARIAWNKRIVAGLVGIVGLATLCLPVAPAKAQVSFGFSAPGVAVGVGGPGYYYSPYYRYPYYYGYPAYSGVYLNFGGHHHGHAHGHHGH